MTPGGIFTEVLNAEMNMRTVLYLYIEAIGQPTVLSVLRISLLYAKYVPR